MVLNWENVARLELILPIISGTMKKMRLGLLLSCRALASHPWVSVF